MVRELFVCYLFLSWIEVPSLWAQEDSRNLVFNPSFELNKKCPEERKNQRISDVYYWYSPTIATPDYYSTCGHTLKCVSPYDGQSYVGGIGGMEFIEGQLRCPLVAGQKYKFSVHVIPALSCAGGLVADNLAVYFSKTPLSENARKRKSLKSEVVPQLKNPTGNVIKDTLKWSSFEAVLTAQGDERYLTIGFFPNDTGTAEYLKETRKGNRWTELNGTIKRSVFHGPGYYAYDNVTLYALDSVGDVDSSFCARFVIPEKIDRLDGQLDLGEYEILANVKFKSGSSELKKGSDEDLKYLWGHYVNFPDQIIELKIHTDTLENWFAEEALCKKRKHELVPRLKAWGVPEESTRYVLVGSKEPLHPDVQKTLGVGSERVEYRLVDK